MTGRVVFSAAHRGPAVVRYPQRRGRAALAGVVPRQGGAGVGVTGTF